MKQWMIAVMLVLISATTFAQNKPQGSAENKGTIFQKGSFNELLEQAGKEKKYLFVDIYTTWCGPCKTMTNEIFPQEKVGDYFNKTFVTTKLDAEKGEGVDIAKKYKVRAYPTFLIIDSKGVEVGRIVGGGSAEVFIEKVQEAVANIGK